MKKRKKREHPKLYSYEELKSRAREANLSNPAAVLRYRKTLPPAEMDRWPANLGKAVYPEYSFEDFFGHSIKHYPYGILKGKAIMAGLHSLPAYWKHRDSLPEDEKRRWPTNLQRAYRQYSFEDFFGRARHSSKKKPLVSWENFLKGIKHFKIRGYDEYEKKRGKLSLMFKKRFPRNPRRAFPEAKKVKYLFWRESKFYPYKRVKATIRLVGVLETAGYLKYRAGLPPEKKAKFPSNLKEAYPDEYSPRDFFPSKHYSLLDLTVKVHKAKIGSHAGYIKYRKALPSEEKKKWPRHPRLFYKDFDRRTFYVQLKKTRGFYPKTEFLIKFREKKFRNLRDYRKFRLAIIDPEEKKRWPENPEAVYENLRWYDLFGVRSWKERFYSYEMLRRRVQKLRLKNMDEYLAYRKSITDPFEKMRWPSILSRAYRGYSPEDFFYNRKGSLSFARAVVFLEKEMALYPTDCLVLREKEPRLPSHPLVFWKKSVDKIFRFRSNKRLIKIGNLFFCNLEFFRNFLLDNGISTKAEYLKARSALPEFEKRLLPADPKAMYLRFYGNQVLNEEMHFYSPSDFTDKVVKSAMSARLKRQK